MKRLAVLLVLLLSIAFYIVWPVYTGLEIKDALEAGDAARLAERIDVPRLKESLKPAARAEAERTIEEQLTKSGGAAGILAGEIARKALPALVDVSLHALVTPENIVRLYAERGDLDGALKRSVMGEIGRAGGLAGLGALKPRVAAPAAAPAGPSPVKTVQPPAEPSPVFKSPVKTLGAPDTAAGAAGEAQQDTGPGWRNVKRLGATGLLTIEAGLARDPAAQGPDMTVELSFTGTGWKLTGLRRGP